MEKFIRKAFEEHRRSEDRDAALLSSLEKAEGADQRDMRVYLNGLRRLYVKPGVGFPFHNSLSSGNPGEIDAFTCGVFKESVEKILPDLVKTDRLPTSFKLLVIDEFLKFYAIVPEALVGESDRLFSFYRDLFGRGSIRLNTPLWFSTKESGQILVELLGVREKFLEILENPETCAPKAPITLIKRILGSQFFRKSFKLQLLDLVLPTFASLSSVQLAEFRELSKEGIGEVTSKRFFFNSKFAENRQYIQFKKNLLFTYFLTILCISKFRKTSIEKSYYGEVLNLVADLFQSECAIDPVENAPRIDADYIKSFVKEFYELSSRNEPPHHVRP